MSFSKFFINNSGEELFSSPQGDGRSFKHVAALSTDSQPIPWPVLSRLAEIIPRICQSISRVAYAFGPIIQHEIEFITETTLVPFHVVSKLQDCDYVAQKVFHPRYLFKLPATLLLYNAHILMWFFCSGTVGQWMLSEHCPDAGDFDSGGVWRGHCGPAVSRPEAFGGAAALHFQWLYDRHRRIARDTFAGRGIENMSNTHIAPVVFNSFY